MPLSLQNLQNFNSLFKAVQSSFDFVPSAPPPSPVARVRGCLRNMASNLQILEDQLGGRDATQTDRADLVRVRNLIESLIEDKWVVDGLAAATLTWDRDEIATSAGVAIPAQPLIYVDAIGMLLAGIDVLDG